MNLVNYFTQQPLSSELPDSFPNPFNHSNHPVAIQASQLLQQSLKSDCDTKNLSSLNNCGKMFGVLVVKDDLGKIGYLSAFSGMLGNLWQVDGFVPPVFKQEDMALFLPRGEAKLKRISGHIKSLENNHFHHYLKLNIKHVKQQMDIELEQITAFNIKHKKQRANERLEKHSLLNEALYSELLKQLSRQSQQHKQRLKQARKTHLLLIKQAEDYLLSQFGQSILYFKNKQKALSQKLHQRVFDGYELSNAQNQNSALTKLFKEGLPPGGSADCAAPKLLQYAYLNHLKPVALAEFWWGESPAKEIRHHANFYQPCRSKCHHILPFMLQGLDLEKQENAIEKELLPTIMYQDDDIIVLNKPAGLLSIPGKEISHSVLTWLKENYPNASGGLLLHRLDQATSGVLLAAKSSGAYKHLQQQFIQRTIKKRYVALLSKRVEQSSATIDLPLRVDLNDRPRQLVCFEWGKSAFTEMKLIQHEGQYSRVYFYPLSGRTHQLRVHAAHKLGLANPIVGDNLYGFKDQTSRLMLHAQKIEFIHPKTLQICSFKVPTPF